MCGNKIAYALLAVLLFYIPMYFFPSMIYTDTATMCIPIICLNLFMRLQTEDMSQKKSAILYILIGIAGGFGFVIKPTAAIMFIAIVIICCVFIRKPKVYKQISLSAALFAVIIILFMIPYRLHVPEDIREAHSIPYAHWVMMGLQNGGRGTWEEFAKTMSFPTYAEKNANAAAVVKSRLNDMGAKGFVKLMGQKFVVLYSRPDFQPGGIIPFYIFEKDTAAAKLGDMRLDNIFYLVYNALVFYGAAILAYVSVFFKTRNITAYLAMFGIHLFFIFWEVNPRWLTNYFFVLIFLACLSVKALAINEKNCLMRE
jgi:4-amino-4-deoxy-L-arabinose transferase-like glycosyltransferase